MAANKGAEPVGERQASPEIQETPETIEVANSAGIFTPVPALKIWKGVHNDITEACVESLGFTITLENGSRRETILLTWGCVGLFNTWKREFRIVKATKSNHKIILGLEASEKATDAKRGRQAFPAFSRRLSKEEKKKREVQRSADKARREREIEEEAREILEKILEERQQQSRL